MRPWGDVAARLAHAQGLSSCTGDTSPGTHTYQPTCSLPYQAGIKQRGVEERPDDRLSWNLDSRSTGGWRAGRIYDLGASTEWVKRVYYR